MTITVSTIPVSDVGEQFLVKDSWHSVLGILEHLHPDEDERPSIPFASSDDTPFEKENKTSEMEVDREVDVPPQALPPPALPPPAQPVVDAGPNSSERKEIAIFFAKDSSTDWTS